MKTTIIGAGPAGNYAAFLLARQGHSVDVYEEHSEIGRPVQCTGVVTQNFLRFIDLPQKCIANRITKVSVVAGKNETQFHLSKPEIILNRAELDCYLAKRAEEAGARFHLGWRYENGSLVKGEQRRKVGADILVGADGPLSKVSEAVFHQRHSFFVGAQVRAKVASDTSMYTVYLGERFGFFAWKVPETKSIARIGVMARKRSGVRLTELLSTHFPDATILEQQGGLIPEHTGRVRTELGKNYLVGDAGAMVKNSTGGGLTTGLTSSLCLADALVSGQSYEKLWRARLGRHLWVHARIQRAIERMSDRDCERLLLYASRPSVKKIIEKSDRDHAFTDVIRIALMEPRLLRFLPKII